MTDEPEESTSANNNTKTVSGKEPEGTNNLATIVGVSIGGVIILVAIVVGALVYIKLKKKKDDNLEDKVNKFNINE